MGSVRGGSMGKVVALELVGRYEGVSGCIGEVKWKLIPRSKLGCEGGVGEGTLGWRDASTMGGRTSDWGDASRIGGGTSSWGDACEMGAGISGLVTTRGVVTRRPRPLTTLVLRLAIARWPWPLAVLGLGFTVAHQPRLGVRRVAVLVHGVVVVVDSVSCLLFAYPFATGPPPSPTTTFRTHRTW